MATSGSVGTTTFSTLKIVDQAFRRCRLPAQLITAEMHSYAKDTLHLILSEFANTKTPSWCITKVPLPMTALKATVDLPVGTVEVLNAYYRTMTVLSGTETDGTTTHKIAFSSATTVNTVGVWWSGDSVALNLQTSPDGTTWTTVETFAVDATVGSGDVSWIDVGTPASAEYFRIQSSSTIPYTDVVYANTPYEIPLGSVNRDIYSAFPNKAFSGRPVNYWFQRDLNPVLHLWPTPDATSADEAQIVVWYHRHIMDVGTLQQEIEIPQRWLEALIAILASRLAEQTPQVDINLIPILSQRATMALNAAWGGDNDGSSTYIQPHISPYTR